MSAIYWWRCFIAAAQRRMKKPIQSAASLEGDRFAGILLSAFSCVIGLEDHRVEEEREKTEDEKQLDKARRSGISHGVDPASRLRGDDSD